MTIKEISDEGLVSSGMKSWEWAKSRMGVIKIITDEFFERKILKEVKIGMCLHITKETAVFALALQRMGAQLAICSANPLSVQDDIVAFLISRGVSVFGHRGLTTREYFSYIKQVLDTCPHILIDDGSEMHVMAHSERITGIKGGTEETTTGIRRMKSLEESHKLKYPVIAVNDADTKRLFDNRYGTGQSTLHAIIRITGMLMAGKNVVVCGYGPVGKGVSERARGLGALVTVTETNGIRALQAYMDGFSVKRLREASRNADLFVTCTGQINVIGKEEMDKMKSGSILANAGHFDTEIDIKYLNSRCDSRYTIKPYLECFEIKGKKIYVLSEGRVVNLIGSEGNAPEVMSMSFANQLLSIIYIYRNHQKLKEKVYDVPKEIDEHVANVALKSFGIQIDSYSDEQLKYIHSYK